MALVTGLAVTATCLAGPRGGGHGGGRGGAPTRQMGGGHGGHVGGGAHFGGGHHVGHPPANHHHGGGWYAPRPTYTTETIWVEGCYVDEVQWDGTVIQVWQPGHYETRTILL